MQEEKKNIMRDEGKLKEENTMAYYKTAYEYEAATGKIFTTDCSNIHRTGSVRGMIERGYWSKDDDMVRHGNYIYRQP